MEIIEIIPLSDKLQIISMNSVHCPRANQSAFSLLRFRKQCYYPPINIDFTPRVRPNLGSLRIFPKFNSDGLFFTPAFVNPYEHSLHVPDSAQAVETEKEKFLQKINNNLSLPTEQNVEFKPRNENYCSICKQGFHSYWDHLNDIRHRNKIRACRANVYVHKLCNAYQKKKKIDRKRKQGVAHTTKKKTKVIRKNANKFGSKKYYYKKQDFIIRIPREIIEKQLEMAHCNNSTNALFSLQHKQ